MICAKAKANVAAISYHFGSKRELYVATISSLYQHSVAPGLTAEPSAVTTAEEWRQQLYAWSHDMLSCLLGDDRWHEWHARLFARERTVPTEVLPLILERFVTPVRNRLEALLRMALPSDVAPEEVALWTVSTIAQVNIYAFRASPWDSLLIPPGVSRQEWIERVSRHIVAGITSRLSFRGAATSGQRLAPRIRGS